MRERFNFSKKERRILLSSVIIIILAQVGLHLYNTRLINNEAVEYDIIKVDSQQSMESQDSAISSPKANVNNSTLSDQLKKESKPLKNLTTVERSIDKEKLIIDINAADAQEWQKLKGIGPSYSKRILSFRRALGGFYSIDQIGETYYLPDSVFRAIQPHLELLTPLRTFNPNINCLDSNFRHPYIAPWELEWIREHVIKVGDIKTIEEFRDLFGHKMKSGKQIEYYLSF